ncbi:MAG: peptidylprolyl isomerase [Bacteroidales bacterium]|nr:peptidylprolyl isomerase [Bacteroidales bacterium]
MALIGTIRKQSGLLVIIVGVALAAFVLGDFLKPRSGSRIVNIAEVYGEDITYSQFDSRYEKNLENTKRNQNKENLTAEEIFRLKQQTFDQIVQKIVLETEYQKLGITVTADELFQLIQGEDPHPYITQVYPSILQLLGKPNDTGYDPNVMREFISTVKNLPASDTYKKWWEDLVIAIKENQLQTKYKNLISKGWLMPDTFTYMDFSERKTVAKIRLVAKSFNDIPDSAVVVTDKDFKDYYEKYKQNYEQEASRDIDYIVFDVKPSAKDRENIRKDVFAVFEDFKISENLALFVNAESDTRYDSSFRKQGELPVRLDSVMFNSPVGTFVEPYVENNAWQMAKLVDVQFRPDSMKATHILISYAGAFRSGENVTRTKEQATKLADSLAEVVKASPGKIESLARSMSDDPSAAENGGDLGWFADGAMVYPFNNAVLNSKVGDITVAESMFGYHVIKTTGKLDPVKKVRVAIIDITINPSQETYQDVYAKASEFQGKVTTLESFDTLAANFGLSKRSATNLLAMGNRIAGIDYPRPIIQWTFYEGIDVGSVSHVFTMENNYIVAIVTKVREKGIPPLEEIKEMMEPLIRKDLKGDVVIEQMKQVAQDSKNLAQIAQKLDSKIDTVENVNFLLRNISGYGNEPNVIAKVFTMQTGVISQPIKGNNAGFFVIVDEINHPAAGEDKKMYERQMLMNFQAKINNNSYITTLQEKANLVDNRVMFY